MDPSAFNLGVTVTKKEILDLAASWIGDQTPLETLETTFDRLGSETFELPPSLAEGFKAMTLTVLAAMLSGRIFFPNDEEARTRWMMKKATDEFVAWWGGPSMFADDSGDSLIHDRHVRQGDDIDAVIDHRLNELREDCKSDRITPLIALGVGHGEFDGQLDLRILADLTIDEIMTALMRSLYEMAFHQMAPPSYQLTCLICGAVADDLEAHSVVARENQLVRIQEHGIEEHGITYEALRSQTANEGEDGTWTYSLPDGRAWLRAVKLS